MLILAIDQGGHASRALAFDLRGNGVAQAFAPLQTQRLDADRVEHDPVQLLQSVHGAIEALVRKLGRDAERIVAAGLATQRSSIVCWHATDGLPLSPVLSWQDRRNATLIDTLSPHATIVQRMTGLVLSPHYGASKLRWCLDHVPAVQSAAREHALRMGPLATYLMRSLLVEQPELVDPANASRTLLWNPATRNWSPELLQLFGVPASVLPTCVPNQFAFGTLPCGDRGIPLTVCTGDQSAAVFADGVVTTATAYLNIGTGAFLLAKTDLDPGEVAPLLKSVLWWDGDRVQHAIEGTVNGAGSALDWLSAHTLIDAHAYARALKELDPSDAPIFLNGVSGVGSPYWRTNFATRFIGAGTPVQQVAAVLESIAFLLTVNFESMRARQPDLARIRATGGLTESNYLCQCIASLCGVPLERAVQQEATARGLAYLIAGMPREWTQSSTTEFTPRHDASLVTRFTRWRTLMAA